jgi:hypothetical protein
MRGYVCECGGEKKPSEERCSDCKDKRGVARQKRTGVKDTDGGRSLIDWEVYHLRDTRPIAGVGESLEVLNAMLEGLTVSHETEQAV